RCGGRNTSLRGCRRDGPDDEERRSNEPHGLRTAVVVMMNGPAISPMQDGDTRLGEITLTGMAIVLLRQRRLVVAVVAASLLVVVIGALATSPTWTASFAFLPGPATDGASRIGGLAA